MAPDSTNLSWRVVQAKAGPDVAEKYVKIYLLLEMKTKTTFLGEEKNLLCTFFKDPKEKCFLRNLFKNNNMKRPGKES